MAQEDNSRLEQDDLVQDREVDNAKGDRTPILAHSSYELPDEVLAGCWRLALASARPAALEMRAIVLQLSSVSRSASVAAMVVRDVGPALAADSERVQQLVSGHLLGEEEDMADMLAELPSAQAATLMRQVGARTAGELRALIEKHEEWTKAQAQQGSVATEPLPGPQSPAAVLRRMENLLEDWCEKCPEAVHAVVGLLLALDNRLGRDKDGAERPSVSQER
ncbi:hypothetical protein ACFUAC_05445 [Streptomyces sp. NPDC057148]|uniref:hypothetical protein n=1 Tax=unclassified Streptomyces TaxID=2593676 RepID=UPI003642F905